MSTYFTQAKADQWRAQYPDAVWADFLEYYRAHNPDKYTDHPKRSLAAAEALFVDIITIEAEEPVLLGTIQSSEKGRGYLGPGVYVFTSAQNNTLVHSGFLNSLEVYCKHRQARLLVSQYTYNKAAYGKNSVKPGSKKATDKQDLWFDEKLAPFTANDSLRIAPGLIWCGDLNNIPTLINPLSRFQGYTRSDSAVIPHAKLAMQSIPTMKDDDPKFLYTTGSVTMRNYIQKTSGQVADFHHVFGATVVEVDKDGTWWVRQINSTDDGKFYDLNFFYTPQGVFTADRILAMNHGDIHWNKRDLSIMDAVFNEDGILDQLKPTIQLFHDTIDFQPRNHHNMKDPHFLRQMLVEGTDSVIAEFRESGAFLVTSGYRDWCRSFVIESNHDMAIDIWLRNPAGQFDAVNARTWHKWNADAYAAIDGGSKSYPFASALSAAMVMADEKRAEQVLFLHEDDSMKVLGIEFGLHGHLGPSGSRGSPKNLRTVGKANTGHTHSAGIVDGVYTAGLYGKLDMGYNKGLSSWSHSLLITYLNGKRAILTIKDGKAWL